MREKYWTISLSDPTVRVKALRCLGCVAYGCWQALVFTVQTEQPGHVSLPAADLRAVVIIASSHGSHLGLGQTLPTTSVGLVRRMHQSVFSFTTTLSLGHAKYYTLQPSFSHCPLPPSISPFE